MDQGLPGVLEARDESLHKISLLKYLNTQSIFLNFETYMFGESEFVRDYDGKIISSSFEVNKPEAINDLFHNNQLEQKVELVQYIRLVSNIDHELNSVKSVLEIIYQTGQKQIIEVT
jgi:hypothetical protein